MVFGLELVTIVGSLAAAALVKEVDQKRCVELAALTVLVVSRLLRLQCNIQTYFVLYRADSGPNLPLLRTPHPHRRRPAPYLSFRSCSILYRSPPA